MMGGGGGAPLGGGGGETCRAFLRIFTLVALTCKLSAGIRSLPLSVLY